MMLHGGQDGKSYFENRNGKMRGNIKGNQPNMKGKSFNIEGGTFELPGGGSIEIIPGDGNSSSSAQPNPDSTN